MTFSFCAIHFCASCRSELDPTNTEVMGLECTVNELVLSMIATSEQLIQQTQVVCKKAAMDRQVQSIPLNNRDVTHGATTCLGQRRTQGETLRVQCLHP